MNTTAAAAKAGVTVATIRTWCRIGAVAATKHAGRWIIDAESLDQRIAIGTRRPAQLPNDVAALLRDTFAQARYEHSPRPSYRAAVTGRYVLPPHTWGSAALLRWGLVDELIVRGRTWYLLTPSAVRAARP
ncbi:helix-turn-helix domain-containing protein [Streptomyces sp. MS06]|uniref:helix-turn-helix domain-containing protein n=1 Tax=Streptomyces sp. MS06 TaxID=3385974 RepID=UPI0039A2C975